jgi:general secretion pathway protein A
MFEEFYGLSNIPFSRDIPSTRIYQPVMLEEILGRLNYAAQRQLFAVVTGDCGTGKTTTIRMLKDSLDPAKYMVLYLADSKLTPRHFYKGLLAQLGVEAMFYRGDAKRQLHHEIELMRGIQHLQPVVIVDEAHLLDREMLEEVRFLLNFKMDSQSPMALILVGQSELWNKQRSTVEKISSVDFNNSSELIVFKANSTSKPAFIRLYSEVTVSALSLEALSPFPIPSLNAIM